MMKRSILAALTLLTTLCMGLQAQNAELQSYKENMKKQHYEKAAMAMKMLLRNPDTRCADYYYKRAEALYKAGDYLYAVADCTSALSYDAAQPKCYYLRALCKVEVGDPSYLTDMQKAGQDGLNYLARNNVRIDDVLGNNAKEEVLSDVDVSIPVNKRKNRNTFVLIISNEKYSESNISDVNFALKDGKVFAEYCQKTLGVPKDNIHIKANATRNQMRSEVRWLKNVADAFNGEASFIVYYSGHGMPDETTKKAYLLPVDGIANDPESAYALSSFYDQLGEMNARSITVFIDACFSGAQRNGGMLTAAKAVAIKPRENRLTGNVIAFAATKEDETAYPLEAKGHGLFTYYLLKKLKDSKGDVTLKQLTDYVTTNVRQYSIVRNNNPQTPTVNVSTAMEATWKEITF